MPNDITEQLTFGQTNQEYQKFVDKFKPKLTTDDCYTPPYIYDAVLGYCVSRYGIDPEHVLRPFYPGGDYEHEQYKPETVVVDNPPFSILTKIVNFYNARGIRFFLFAPALTCIGIRGATKIVTYASVVYENGADIKTAFVTNMEPGTVARSDPELKAIIDAATQANTPAKTNDIKYDFPENVLTAAMLQYMSNHGVQFSVRENEATFIRTLDHMRQFKKGIFGSALLLSTDASLRRRNATRSANDHAVSELQKIITGERLQNGKLKKSIEWQLSDRERAIIAYMDERSGNNDTGSGTNPDGQ